MQITPESSRLQTAIEVTTKEAERCQMEEDFYKLMMNLGSAYFYGDFKAETENERAIQSILEKYRFFFHNENEVVAKRALIEKLYEDKP